MFVRHPMDRMLSCYLDKMIESPHFSLPPFRNYVKNKAREVMAKRRKAQLANEIHIFTSDLSKIRVSGRKLLSVGNRLKRLFNQDSEIIYGQRIMKRGSDMTEHKTEETETMKLHRFLVQQKKKSSTIKPTQRPVEPSRKENYTNVKPTFEEFLEFVLDTDLQGKQIITQEPFQISLLLLQDKCKISSV